MVQEATGPLIFNDFHDVDCLTIVEMLEKSWKGSSTVARAWLKHRPTTVAAGPSGRTSDKAEQFMTPPEPSYVHVEGLRAPSGGVGTVFRR